MRFELTVPQRMTPDLLATIYGCSLRAIEATDDALSEKLITDEDDIDDVEARARLTRARSAAVTLKKHLESAFTFTGGVAEPIASQEGVDDGAN